MLVTTFYIIPFPRSRSHQLTHFFADSSIPNQIVPVEHLEREPKLKDKSYYSRNENIPRVESVPLRRRTKILCVFTSLSKKTWMTKNLWNLSLLVLRSRRIKPLPYKNWGSSGSWCNVRKVSPRSNKSRDRRQMRRLTQQTEDKNTTTTKVMHSV